MKSLRILRIKKISSTDLKQRLINESETGRTGADPLNTKMSPENIIDTKDLPNPRVMHPSILLTTDFGSYLNYPYLIEPEDGLNELK